MAERFNIDKKCVTCKNCGDYRVFWTRSRFGSFYLVNVAPDNTFAKDDFHSGEKGTCGKTFNQLPPVAATSEVNSATVDMLNQMYSKPAVWPGTVSNTSSNVSRSNSPLSNPQTIGRMTGNGQSVQNLPRVASDPKLATFKCINESCRSANFLVTKPWSGKPVMCNDCKRMLKFLNMGQPVR